MLGFGFFIHGQNQKLVRKIQIKSHDIIQFLDEALVPAEFETPDQVGLQVELFPDSPNGRFAQVLGLCHRLGTPMGGVQRLGMKSCFDHGFNFPLRDSRDLTRTGRVFFQARQAESQKSFPSQLDPGPQVPQFASDMVEDAGRRFQNDLGALDKMRGKASASRPRFQRPCFLWRQDDWRAVLLIKH